jgi:tRNA-specific 2-thiouridylase
MSGGVDSSLAAATLVEQGYEVVGATIKTFCYAEVSGSSKACCGLEGIADARAVAQRLGIAHYVFDLEDEFTHDVIDDFVTEYAAGRTPNPCVLCNSHTKFRDLLRRARMLGCERIATGHYARCVRSGRGTQLIRAADRAKDQTYFLWGIDREVLERLELPVGELSKTEVRGRARELGLATADKPESFDICFVPDGDYAGFLATRLDGEHPRRGRSPRRLLPLHDRPAQGFAGRLRIPDVCGADRTGHPVGDHRSFERPGFDATHGRWSQLAGRSAGSRRRGGRPDPPPRARGAWHDRRVGRRTRPDPTP